MNKDEFRAQIRGWFYREGIADTVPGPAPVRDGMAVVIEGRRFEYGSEHERDWDFEACVEANQKWERYNKVVSRA